MPDDKADINTTADPKLVLQSRKMELDAEAKKLALEAEGKRLGLETGWIGKVVGSSKNAPYNIAFLTLLFTFAAGIIVLCWFPNDRMEFWKLLIPIITFTLGYVFGSAKKSSGI